MSLVKRKNDVWFPSLVDEFLKPDWFGGMENLKASVPSVNIKESEDHFQIELAAPGLKKDDFNIAIDENVLTISSSKENKNEIKEDEGKYTRREFSYSEFKRAFNLPETIDEGKINASYENGVLVLTLPKKEEALPKPKKFIEIS
ncbi:Hsp20/alpha crystallin family protein [Zhouia sp. PK063]|uniref:Hsp20/alpha crystallin family protein n=1 Tax=Zhouia sp. PK063 TaxID=3373602 RepID=UPI00378E1354